MKAILLCFGLSFVLESIAFAELGDSPEQVGREMKQGRLVGVNEGLDRHVIEASFSNDGVMLIIFLDGRVCRETRVREGDAPQDKYIQLLLTKGSGHSWSEMKTGNPNRRWRRDDGVDIIYGAIDKVPAVKHAVCITAPEFIQHLQRMVTNDGADVPGTCPSVEQVRSAIEAGMRP